MEGNEREIIEIDYIRVELVEVVNRISKVTNENLGKKPLSEEDCSKLLVLMRETVCVGEVTLKFLYDIFNVDEDDSASQNTAKTIIESDAVDTENTDDADDLWISPEQISDTGTINILPTTEPTINTDVETAEQRITIEVLGEEVIQSEGIVEIATEIVAETEETFNEEDDDDEFIADDDFEEYTIEFKDKTVDSQVQNIGTKHKSLSSENKTPDVQTNKVEYYKPYNCEICKKSFARKKLLKQHKKRHYSSKPYKCEMCTMSFALKDDLNKHMKRHLGIKPHTCGNCDKSFPDNFQLNQHKQRVHIREKLHKCDKCEKSYSDKAYLRGHQRTAHSNKPFRCDLCVKTFSKVEDLNHHKLMIHTIKTSYSCEVCSKSFTRKYTLSQHKNLHTGEKPFSCKQCGKLFAKRCSLTYHEKMHIIAKPLK